MTDKMKRCYRDSNNLSFQRMLTRPKNVDFSESSPGTDSKSLSVRDPVFLGNLMRPLRPWDLIIIEGKAPKNAHQIDVSFENTRVPSDTLPFLLSIQFSLGAVVRNTKIDDEWGNEEIEENLLTKNVRQVLRRGKRFVLTFFMSENEFLISINKKAFCTYRYRVKLKFIRTIRVSRDAYRVIRVDHRSFFPSPWPKYITPAMMSFDTPEPLVSGWVIIFGGVIYAKAGCSFDVRIFEMGSQRIRLLMRFSENRIAYYENSTETGYHLAICNEVVQHSNPLKHMEPFRIAIGIGRKEFRIAINGQIQKSYPYFSRVSALTGLKFLEQKARLMVSSVDYMKIDDECRGFAVFSKLNFKIT